MSENQECLSTEFYFRIDYGTNWIWKITKIIFTDYERSVSLILPILKSCLFVVHSHCQDIYCQDVHCQDSASISECTTEIQHFITCRISCRLNLIFFATFIFQILWMKLVLVTATLGFSRMSIFKNLCLVYSFINYRIITEL